MIKLVLLAVSVLIGLRIERWRGAFIGAASVGGACVILLGATSLIKRTDGVVYLLTWALFTGVLIGLVSLGVIALTFAIKKANWRPKSDASAP